MAKVALAEVQDVSERILIIHKGRIRADGTLTQLLEHGHGRRLVAAAAMAAEELQRLIGELSGVESVAITGRDGEFATVEARLVPHADPRDEAFARLRARGAAVRELHLSLPSLEEYFYEVTEGADAAAERAASAAAPAE